jgi:predicted TIM-barrel fold metal-dependent hydrolase
LERCHKAGLKGALIWQAPHPDLPFHSNHYDKFWAAAQDLKAPVSLHILTGHGYFAQDLKGIERYRGSVNLKLAEIVNALFDFIFYGVLERYPGLKLVSVENESGWIPFIVQQWDYYYRRFRDVNPVPVTKDPSDYMRERVFASFFNDAVGGRNLKWWGEDNLMWSNDFPHPNSTWPNSLKVIQRDLGHLPVEAQTKVLTTNVCSLYGLDVSALPAGISRAAQAAA